MGLAHTRSTLRRAALTTVVTNRSHRVDAHGPRNGQNLITPTLQICRKKMPTASRSQRTCVSRLLPNLRSILTSSLEANRRSSNSTKKPQKVVGVGLQVCATRGHQD